MLLSASAGGGTPGAKMVLLRRKTMKVFTLAFLLITVTSFLLNYTHQVTSTTWDPRHLVVQFSEHVQKLFKYPRRPCSCHTCISELGHSLWFDQRFNSTMQPFLTSHNALIPEDSYRWWLVSEGCGYSPGFGWQWGCQASRGARHMERDVFCPGHLLSQLTRWNWREWVFVLVFSSEGLGLHIHLPQTREFPDRVRW